MPDAKALARALTSQPRRLVPHFHKSPRNGALQDLNEVLVLLWTSYAPLQCWILSMASCLPQQARVCVGAGGRH